MRSQGKSTYSKLSLETEDPGAVRWKRYPVDDLCDCKNPIW